MGVLIVTEQSPDTSEYQNWKCYRATSEAGSYSVINGANGQAIADMTYYDESGVSTHWYKVSYYNTSTTKETGLSDAIKGQSTTYTTVKKVVSLTQFTTLTDSTNPTVQEVVEMINRKEDEIDYVTGHAWRQRYSNTNSGLDTDAKYESHDIRGVSEYNTGLPIHLGHRFLKDLDADEGDELDIWNGSEWEDWIAEKTEGRTSDFWIDYIRGILYLRTYRFAHKTQGLRLKYRYGEVDVNRDIEDIATKMTAIDLLTGADPRSFMVPEGSSALSHESRINIWQKEVNKKIHRYKEFRTPGLL